MKKEIKTSTGDKSTGGSSTGNRSTGFWSTGNGSTGNRSTGDSSTGYRSTGDWSISNYSTGHFSTKDYDGFGAFNKPCTPNEWENANKPSFLYFDLTKWVADYDMTDSEKNANPTYTTTGGYLKVYEYKEAWRRSFDAQENKEKQIKQLEALPNFDYDVFVEISGIDYRKEQSLTGQQVLVVIGDKTYQAVIK